ncbi:GGDEF domain-containing protein [Salinimonas sediminis]|uniref:diguanylate cyclase n=1 Tax=Salinimonas sediminis TaxID=2303538 RepID=A0A346NII7_9ALTE|nr:GGDEF domain-containing protein [Salinimonas sediminis]AXR05344.1 GGDEF domain-containing protein [Salinimonas sediminis]
MDNFTLTICTMLVSIMMAAAMAGLYGTSRDEAALPDWIAAMLCFSVSSLLAVVHAYWPLPFLLVPGIANALYLAGHGFIFSGIRQHIGGRSAYNWIAVLALFSLSLHFLPAIATSLDRRIIIFYAMVLALCLASALYILVSRRQCTIGGYTPLLWVLGLFFTQMLLREVAMVADLAGVSVPGSAYLRSAGSLFVMLYIIAIAMAFAYLITWQKAEALRTSALTDSLTGWYNRRALMRMAPQVFDECRNKNQSLCIVILDVDHFKQINDTYGHVIGDKVLQHITVQARQAYGPGKWLFRLGGEEFAILLADTEPEQASSIAEKIREAVNHSPYQYHKAIWVSISLGIAAATAQDVSWEAVLDRADKALYQAKATGRNTVCSDTTLAFTGT